MSENLRTFTQAVYAFDAVVQRTAGDQWGNDTPCDGWDARQLLEHQCAVLNGVQRIAETGAMARPTPPASMDDPQAVWADTRDRLLASLDRQGALAQQGPFWFDLATVDDLIGTVMWDPVAHAWDLAQATGQPHGISEDLAEAAIAVIEPVADSMAESGRTAGVLEAAADASAIDRYLALTGRSPSR